MIGIDKSIKKVLNDSLKHGDKRKLMDGLNALEMFSKKQGKDQLETKKIKLIKDILK